MFRPATMLNAGPGITYEMLAPRLDASDAQHDGRMLLLAIAAGAGIPEMLLTGDWSHANRASAGEALAAAHRERYDRQDFFRPVFTRIAHWVLDAGVEGRGLPASTRRAVSIEYPDQPAGDPEKATNRRQTLHQHQILSKRTWAAQEDMDLVAEAENMREDQEGFEAPLPPPNVVGSRRDRRARPNV